MELSEQNFASLQKYLYDTLNPDVNVRKPGDFLVLILVHLMFKGHTHFLLDLFSFLAESFLESVEVNENYPMLLLKLLTRDNVEMTIRIACAITFKNYIKRNWKTVS